jgi:hypothetical protein
MYCDEIGYKVMRIHVKNETLTGKYEFKFPDLSLCEFKLSKQFLKGCEAKEENGIISEISF